RGVLWIDQHTPMLGRKGEAHFREHLVRLDEVQDAGGRLLLQPLARIPAVDTGARGERNRIQRLVLERLIEAETVTEVDREQLAHCEGRLEQAILEGLPRAAWLMRGSEAHGG